jgi:predicted phage tail protein
MDRKALESAAANYPYLQGLWALPMGILIIVTGVSNLQRRPSGPWMLVILVASLALAGVASLLIARYYRDNYGEVTPTRGRQVRNVAAIAAWVVVIFVGANRYLFWSLDSPFAVYVIAFAVATLVYYAILTGLRVHHMLIWGSVMVAGFLPVWGGLGVDRDAVAMFPLGVALMVSGVLDQRLLARSLRPSTTQDVEPSHVGR